MACISVGSFHLAVKQLGLLPIDTEDLVAISQVSPTSASAKNSIIPKYTQRSVSLLRCKHQQQEILKRFLERQPKATLVFWAENFFFVCKHRRSRRRQHGKVSNIRWFSDFNRISVQYNACPQRHRHIWRLKNVEMKTWNSSLFLFYFTLPPCHFHAHLRLCAQSNSVTCWEIRTWLMHIWRDIDRTHWYWQDYISILLLNFLFLSRSQCRCTARDLERMAEIVESKLGVQMNTSAVTGLTFIRLFYHIFRHAAKELDLSAFYDKAITLFDLEQRMEILACDASCASIRPSELALVMLCTQLDASVSKLNVGTQQQISGLVDYAIQMQKLCRVSWKFSMMIKQK